MEFYSSLDASQLDSETPTLFELISSSQLEGLLSPSLRYILVHYASQYPRYLLKINNSFDEINLVVRSFIEWYFINYWQGSFTENFYGLKRVNNTIIDTGKLSQLVPSMVEERRGLTPLQQIASLFEITGVAYIHEKLSYSYERWYTKYITQQLMVSEMNTAEENRKIYWKRKFVEIYPYIQSGYKILNLFTTLLYLSGKSKSPTFITWLFNINYSRLNQYDYSKNDAPISLAAKAAKINRINPENDLQKGWKLLSNIFLKPTWKAIKYILGTFFPVAIFSLKFLEWWNNSEFSTQLLKSQGNLLDFTLPSPSTLTTALKRGSDLPREKVVAKNYKSGKTCPICKNELTNPAIIETGYVFDYSCIYNYLQESHKIVGEKLKNQQNNVDDEEDEDYQDEDEDSEEPPTEKEKPAEIEEDTTPVFYDISKGGRCPITGKKLLGCKWNSIKEEWEIEGIRRLIF